MKEVLDENDFIGGYKRPTSIEFYLSCRVLYPIKLKLDWDIDRFLINHILSYINDGKMIKENN